MFKIKDKIKQHILEVVEVSRLFVSNNEIGECYKCGNLIMKDNNMIIKKLEEPIYSWDGFIDPGRMRNTGKTKIVERKVLCCKRCRLE